MQVSFATGKSRMKIIMASGSHYCQKKQTLNVTNYVEKAQ